MDTKITASRLRENVYAILDEVLETGVPVEITRKGKTLRIVPDVVESKLSRLERLPKREPIIIGDPEDLVHMDWSHEWTELQNVDKPLAKAARGGK